MTVLSSAAPGVEFEWLASKRELVCTFGDDAGTVASVNRRLLPVLLAQVDVLAVTPGLSLEEAFLGGSVSARTQGNT